MLIAVASKDGKEINQHFGHADRFLIYEVEEGRVRLVDERPVERYCSYDPDHPLRGHLLSAIAATIGDCRMVVTAQIGEHPRSELERLGIESFAAGGAITVTLAELAKIV